MQFLVAQSTYSDVQVGLFDNSRLVSSQIIQKFNVCKQLISTIQELLNNANTSLDKLQFIGINQGPAPFNTLRTLISTTNGIAYATKVPLVSVNGIKALYASSHNSQTVIVLNAFNNEAYYAYKKQTALIIGVANINDVLQTILLDIPHGAITFVGNGAHLFKEHIKTALGARAHIAPTTFNILPLEKLAEICLNKFNQNEYAASIQPLYIKRAI